MNAWESRIIAENTELASQKRAVVIKVPTPHRILYSYDGGGKHLGNVERRPGRFLVQYQSSTVDFIGEAEGRGVAFEAKSTDGDTLNLYGSDKGGGLKRHQRNFLAHWRAGGGIAFVYLVAGEHRFVLPCDVAGVVAGVAPSKRASWPVDPESRFRCRDGEAWLDALERLGEA